MISDRELLEAAARACGFGDFGQCMTWTESEYPPGSKTNGAFWNYQGWGDTAVLWNPLTSDADAFRLMVDCGITAHQYSTCVAAKSHKGIGVNCEESFGTDKRATTRRAIVRAAAAMSEGQEG